MCLKVIHNVITKMRTAAFVMSPGFIKRGHKGVVCENKKEEMNAL